MSLLGVIMALNVRATRADDIKSIPRETAVRVAEDVSRKLGHLPSPLSRVRVGIARCNVATRAVNAGARDTSTVPCVVLYPDTVHAFEQLRGVFGDQHDDVIITYQLSSDGPTWPEPGPVVDYEDPDQLVAGVADVLRSMAGVTKVGWGKTSDGGANLIITVADAEAARALRTLWPVNRRVKNMSVRILYRPPGDVGTMSGEAALRVMAKVRAQLDHAPAMAQAARLSVVPYDRANDRVGAEVTEGSPYELALLVATPDEDARALLARELGDEVDGLRLVHRRADGAEFGRINPVGVFFDVDQMMRDVRGVIGVTLGRDDSGPRVDVRVRDDEAHGQVLERLPPERSLSGVPLGAVIETSPTVASAEDDACENLLTRTARRVRAWWFNRASRGPER